jgi:hypothetical protein
MFSTDGYAFPETFYLGAKWSREILARVLIEAFDNGDMLLEEALAAADGILGRNALEFYKLDGRDGFSASTDNLTKLQQSISGTNLLVMDRVQSIAPKLPPSIQDMPKISKFGNGMKGGILKDEKDEGDCKAEEQSVIVDIIEPKTPVDSNLVKHVRLLLADGSGQRRCRVCFNTTFSF